MVRTLNRKRNVKVVDAKGAASLVERMGTMACRLVWATAGLGVLALVVKVLLG